LHRPATKTILHGSCQGKTAHQGVQRCYICRVGQTRMHTLCMTIYLVTSLPKVLYIHRMYICRVGGTIYIQFVYGSFSREITKYTVIYSVDIQFWPTLYIYNSGQLHNHVQHLQQWTWLGLAITIYIRCIYGIFGREIIEYTVIYGVYIIYTVLANPRHG